MLEVVRVNLAALHDVIGLHIVREFLDIKGDVLLGQNVPGDCQNFRVGRGGGRDGDRLAGELGVIDRRVKAVAGVLNDADHGALILLRDEIRDLLALQRRLQRLDGIGVLVALLDREDVAVCGGGALDQQGILHRIEARRDGVVGIDDGVVHILQNVGDLGGLDLLEVDAVGVFLDVVDGRGDTGAIFQLDVSVLLQQKQGARFVGGVVRNRDGNRAFAGAAGQNAQRQNGGEKYSKDLFHVSIDLS